MFKFYIKQNITYEQVLRAYQSQIDSASAVIYEQIKLYADQFTPRQSGALIDTAEPIILFGAYVGIRYTMPYARRLYFGDDFNFRIIPNPKARSRWVQEAWNIYHKQIMAAVKAKWNGS